MRYRSNDQLHEWVEGHVANWIERTCLTQKYKTNNGGFMSCLGDLGLAHMVSCTISFMHALLCICAN